MKYAIKVNGQYVEHIKGTKTIKLIMTDDIQRAYSFPLAVNATNAMSRFGIVGKITPIPESVNNA